MPLEPADSESAVISILIRTFPHVNILSAGLGIPDEKEACTSQDDDVEQDCQENEGPLVNCTLRLLILCDQGSAHEQAKSTKRMTCARMKTALKATPIQ